VKILKGKQIIDIDDNGLKEIASNFKDIIVDIGTGDGKFVYNLAKQNSQSLFIGIDSSAEGMFDYSIKSSSKPAKGGLKNVLYVVANAEELPNEMSGLADKIYVNLPWGSLRDGIIKGEGIILENLKEIAKKGSYIELCIAYSELYEKKEIEIRQLPQLSYEYINTVLREKYKASNLDICSIELLYNDKLKKVNTKWAKKLAFGRQRTIYYFKCKVF
jgi:16S rRNA (adenine(1408)-N(1))-methyltransferase